MGGNDTRIIVNLGDRGREWNRMRRRWAGFCLTLEKAVSRFAAGFLKRYVWCVHANQVKRRSEGCPAFPFVEELGSRSRFGLDVEIVDDGATKANVIEVAHADGSRTKSRREGALGLLNFVGIWEPII